MQANEAMTFTFNSAVILDHQGFYNFISGVCCFIYKIRSGYYE